MPEYQPASHRLPRLTRTRLRTDLPQEDEPSLRTLRLSADGILTRLRATYSGILTSASSTRPCGRASPYCGTLPYQPSSAECGMRSAEERRCDPSLLRLPHSPFRTRKFPRFGVRHKPPYIIGAGSHSTSKLLRTLSMVAASKPTSWLSTCAHILLHLAGFGDLSGWSGLFPSRP